MSIKLTQRYIGAHRDRTAQEGITLIELLVVIAILGILASVVLPRMSGGVELAREKRAVFEMRQMENALYRYEDTHGVWPGDVDRNLPPGLEEFLASGDADGWPDAPFPGSVYDWDVWDDPDNPGERIYQISIRFCPMGGPIDACKFPHREWADGFQVNSSMYWCLEGACRPHISEPVDYPGYCVNCP